MKAGVKVIIMVALGFVFIGLLVFLPKAYANAAEDKRHCVTNQEWNKLHVHMDKAGVHRLLDGGGHHNYPNTRWYRICDHGADWRVIVWYRNGHLHNAYWMYSSTGYIDAKAS